MAVILRNDLNKHAEVLDALAAKAPSDLHAKLDGAKQVTLLGASMADNISKGFVAGATGTPVPARRVVVQGVQANRPSSLLLEVDAERHIFVTGEVVELGRGTVRL